LSFHSALLLKDILRTGGKAPVIPKLGSMQVSDQLQASAALSTETMNGLEIRNISCLCRESSHEPSVTIPTDLSQMMTIIKCKVKVKFHMKLNG
jgi:hypothetical protein